MNTKMIKSGVSSFTLETEKPISWSLDGTITLDIVSLDGVTLISDNSVSTYTGDTIASSAVAGDYTLELNTGVVLAAGDRIAVGSIAKDYQYLIVDSYDTASKTITLDNCIDKNIAIGANVIGLKMSSIVDISGESFTDVKEVQIKWKSDSNDLPMSEIWRILKSYNQPDGMQLDFRLAYPSLADSIPDVEALHTRANQWMVEYFNTKNRDFLKIVDNQLTKETVMLKMALMVGLSGDIGNEMYLRLTEQFKTDLTTLDNLPIWIDANDDDVQDEQETQRASMYDTVKRGI